MEKNSAADRGYAPGQKSGPVRSGRDAHRLYRRVERGGPAPGQGTDRRRPGPGGDTGAAGGRAAAVPGGAGALLLLLRAFERALRHGPDGPAGHGPAAGHRRRDAGADGLPARGGRAAAGAEGPGLRPGAGHHRPSEQRGYIPEEKREFRRQGPHRQDLRPGLYQRGRDAYQAGPGDIPAGRGGPGPAPGGVPGVRGLPGGRPGGQGGRAGGLRGL